MTETFEDHFVTSLQKIDIENPGEIDRLSWYRYLAPDSIAEALVGFELRIQKDTKWLSLACKTLMFEYIGNARYFLFEETEESYPGSTKIRRELKQMAERLVETRLSLSGLSMFSDSILKRYSHITDDSIDTVKEIEKREIDGAKKGEPTNYDFKVTDLSLKAIELDRMLKEFEDFTLAAMERLCPENEKPRWRDTERRKVTVDLAVQLAKVFEFVTGEKATVNNWPHQSGHLDFGPWHDFFIRFGCLMLKVEKIPDSIGVLKDARRIRLNENSRNR